MPMLAACSASAPTQKSSTATNGGREAMSDGQPGSFLGLGSELFGGDRAGGRASRARASGRRLLDDRRAALEPVAAIGVDHAVIVMQRGAVEVAADDAVELSAARRARSAAPRSGRQRRISRLTRATAAVISTLSSRPIAAAAAVQQRVQPAHRAVEMAAEPRQPARLAGEDVAAVAMHDQVAPAVRCGVDRSARPPRCGRSRCRSGGGRSRRGCPGHRRSACRRASAPSASGSPRRASADHSRADRPPAVEEVADQVDHLGVVALEEVEHPVGAAAVGAEVHVGQEQAAVAPLRRPRLAARSRRSTSEGRCCFM